MHNLFHDSDTSVKINELHLKKVKNNELQKFCEILGSFSENSNVANARFQAAGAIRDAAIREWGFLSADDRRNLIRYQLLKLPCGLYSQPNK